MTTVFDRLPPPPESFVEAHPHGRINWRVYATDLLYESPNPFRDSRAPVGSCTLRSGGVFGEVVLPLYSMAEYEAAEVAHRSGKMLTLSLFIPLAQPKPALDVAKLRERLLNNEREQLLANVRPLTDETLRELSMLPPGSFETKVSNEALLALVNEVHELRAYKATLSPEGALELAARLQHSEADAERWREHCNLNANPEGA